MRGCSYGSMKAKSVTILGLFASIFCVYNGDIELTFIYGPIYMSQEIVIWPYTQLFLFVPPIQNYFFMQQNLVFARTLRQRLKSAPQKDFFYVKKISAVSQTVRGDFFNVE